MVLRFYFMKHYYRGPLDFSIEDLQVSEKTYKRLVNFFSAVTLPEHQLIRDEVKNNTIVQAMSDCLADDFNTSGLFGVLFESLDTLRATPKLKETPVIVLSNSIEPDEMQTVKAHGATDVFMKARVTPMQICTRIRELTKRT